MTPSRRAVLQWAAAGAALAGLPLPALAADSGAGLVLLLGGSRADQAFLAGIDAAKVSRAEVLSLPPGDMAALASLEQRLMALKGQCIVGLLDEGRQTLVDEYLRQLGARVLCCGRHSAGGASHRFVTTSRARGIGVALAGGLSTAGETFLVHEASLGADASAGKPVTLHPGRGWAGMTGESLARIAAGDWTAGAAGQYRGAGNAPGLSAGYGLVSFAVQL